MSRDPLRESRRRFLRAALAAGVGSAVAGCGELQGSLNGDGESPTDSPTGAGGDGGDGGDASDPLQLLSEAVEALSLTETGRESISVDGEEGQIVAYRRDRENPTLVESFAGNVGSDAKPVGRSVYPLQFLPDEASFPVEESPSVKNGMLFVPAGARRDGEVAADEVLAIVPGSEMPAEVTVDNENTRLVVDSKHALDQTTGTDDWSPGTEWIPMESKAKPGLQWIPAGHPFDAGSGWVTSNEWAPGGRWIVDPPYRPADAEAVPWPSAEYQAVPWPEANYPPETQVLVSSGDRAFAEVFGSEPGEAVESGATVSTENRLFAAPISGPFLESTEDIALYDRGYPTPLGGAGAGIALLSVPELDTGQPASLLGSAAGKRALSMAGATNAATEEVEWLAGPTAIGDLMDVTPTMDAYTGQFLGGSADIRTYGGVMASAYGPYAVLAHVAKVPPGTYVIGVESTPLGSTTPFEEEQYDRVFPRSRVHNGQGLTWAAGGGDIETMETAFGTSDCAPETVSGDIESDTTWSAGECPRVALDGRIIVRDGATLTIEPGVEVVAKAGARLVIQGTLEVRGEPTNPVWFYGENDEPGYWEGIWIRTESDNVIDNAVVRNGGLDGNPNIFISGGHRASVTNTLSERCSTSGLVAAEKSTLAEFSNNAFRSNGFAAVELPTSHMDAVDTASTYAGGNQHDAVYVVNSARVNSETTWPDVPFRFEGGNHRIQAPVTVAPGTTLTFEQEGRITALRDGTLTAEGTSEDPVTFEGATAEPGFWDGIRLRGNTHSFDHVEIAHGGGNDLANIQLDGDAEVSITNTLFEGCSTSGLVVTEKSTLREFSNNTFRNNEFAAVELPTSQVGSVDAESTYAGGNQYDAVYVVNSARVNSETTWPAAPFRFEGANHRIQASVTVAPGASLTFEEGARITALRDGALTAEGTSEDPISFTGATDTQGFWEGIWLRTNTHSFDHVEVANGGRNDFANIYVSSEASVTNSTLRASATYGIIVTDGATFQGSNNTYQNNAEGAIQGADQ
jgi:hypothetical protein